MVESTQNKLQDGDVTQGDPKKTVGSGGTPPRVESVIASHANNATNGKPRTPRGGQGTMGNDGSSECQTQPHGHDSGKDADESSRRERIDSLQKQLHVVKVALHNDQLDEAERRCTVVLAIIDHMRIDVEHESENDVALASQRGEAEDMMVEIYTDQGRYEKVVQVFESKVERLQKLRGPEASETLESKIGLSKALFNDGQLDAAEELCHATLQSVLRGGDANHHLRNIADELLARIYFKKGKLEAAADVMCEQLGRIERSGGCKSSATVAVQCNLANIYFASDRHVEAEAMFRDVLLTMKESNVGVMFINIVESNLVVILVLQENLKAALKAAASALKRRLATYGEDSKHTWRAYYMVGDTCRLIAGCSKCLSCSGHTPTELDASHVARAYLTLALTNQARVLGDDHSDTILSRNSLSFLDAGCCPERHQSEEGDQNVAAASGVAEEAAASVLADEAAAKKRERVKSKRSKRKKGKPKARAKVQKEAEARVKPAWEEADRQCAAKREHAVVQATEKMISEAAIAVTAAADATAAADTRTKERAAAKVAAKEAAVAGAVAIIAKQSRIKEAAVAAARAEEKKAKVEDEQKREAERAAVALAGKQAAALVAAASTAVHVDQEGDAARENDAKDARSNDGTEGGQHGLSSGQGHELARAREQAKDHPEEQAEAHQEACSRDQEGGEIMYNVPWEGPDGTSGGIKDQRQHRQDMQHAQHAQHVQYMQYMWCMQHIHFMQHSQHMQFRKGDPVQKQHVDAWQWWQRGQQIKAQLGRQLWQQQQYTNHIIWKKNTE